MGRRRGHDEGSIYRRDDGLWTGAVSLGYDERGKRKRRTVYGKTRREVAEKLTRMLRDHQQGIPVAPERLSVAQFLERWLTASVKPSVKVKTYEGYESIARVRVIPRIGKRRLAKVTPLDLQQLYSDLQAAGLSNRSVHHTHRVLHRTFVQAVRWDLIPRNPCDGVTPPRPNRAEMHVLDREQVSTLLAATTDSQRRTLYTLTVTTGMRAGELYGLRWGDIDLSAGRLSVRRALQRQRGNGLVFVTPKTARSRRTIILSKWAVSVLREHRSRQLEQRLAAGPLWQDDDLVFCGALGRPLDPSTESGRFSDTLKRAGLPHVRFHDLRHTAATLLLGQGTHPKVVSEMLGHGSIALTLDTYSHLVPALHEQAAAAMDSLFGAAM